MINELTSLFADFTKGLCNNVFLLYLCSKRHDQLLLNPPGPEGSKGRRL